MNELIVLICVIALAYGWADVLADKLATREMRFKHDRNG